MGAKARKAPTAAIFAVTAGQVYRVPRPGKPARHVKIDRVLTRNNPPHAACYEITRSGKRKGPQKIAAKRDARGNVEKWTPNVVYHCLTWSRGAWRMGPGFVLVSN